MLLVVDVGNTNIVLGIFCGDRLVYDWRISTDKDKTSDEYGLLLCDILAFHGLDTDDIGEVIIASVVPNLMHTLPAMCNRYFGIEPVVVGTGTRTGINIRYDNPKEVGADRIVNAVAGHDKYGGDMIIVDIGTAITFDVISEKGDYLGGAIAPGIGISSEALFIKTARLPKIELALPKSVIGKNTLESMRSGIVHGYIGLVDNIIKKILEEWGKSPEEVKVIGTGGYSQLIAENSRYIQMIDKMLTLDGLRLVHEKVKSSRT